MLKQERQIYILEKVKKEGRATTNELVQELGLAEDTIRKDFQEMSAKGLVKRIHGGVLKVEEELINFDERITHKPSVKLRLAQRAAELVKDKKMLYIDGGTTNLRFAESLPVDFNGTVVTNSPTISIALCKFPDVHVTLLGGNLNKTTKIVEGSSAIQQMSTLNFECAVIGVSSLSPENGITFPSYDESVLKQEAIRHCKQTIAIANKEKLGTVAGFYAGDLSMIDVLVTNEKDESILQKYFENGIEIIIEDIE